MPRYNKESFLDLLNEDYEKEIVKPLLAKKKEKIRFILSFTNDDLRPSHPYYKDLFKSYLKMDDQEIDFNYYHFKKEAKKYGL